MSLRRGGRSGISPTAASGLLLPRPGEQGKGEAPTRRLLCAAS